jgi:hypothetical protein
VKAVSIEEELRVPLDAKKEAMRGRFDGFDDSVGRDSAGH